MKLSEYKRKQIEHENRHRPQYNLELVNLAPVERFYLERQYRFALSLLEELALQDQIDTILVCGLGAGADLAFWLSHLHLEHAFGLDFSIEAIKATVRKLLLEESPGHTSSILADFETIPLQDDAVDLGIFVNSLHHALDPAMGYRELWRVSRKGVLLIEPYSTPITRLFARIGLAEDVEEAGNKVVRFQTKDFLLWSEDQLCQYKSRPHLWYYHPAIFRRLLPVFDSGFGFELFKILYSLADLILIPLRSKLAIVLAK